MLQNGSSHSPHLVDGSPQRAQHRGVTPQDYLGAMREQFECTLTLMEVGCSFLAIKWECVAKRGGGELTGESRIYSDARKNFRRIWRMQSWTIVMLRSRIESCRDVSPR